MASSDQGDQRREVDNETSVDQVEQVNDIIGDWGRWQSNIAAFSITMTIFTSLNGLSSNFYQAPTDIQCTDESFVTYWSQSGRNSSQVDQCSLPDGTKCTSWRYLNGQMNGTATEQFNWVCSHSWIASFSVTMYWLGVLATGVIAGVSSDNFGRKKTVIAALLIEIAAGIASSLAPNTLCFVVARFFQGFGTYGRQTTNFLIAVESVGTKYRAIIGIAIHLGWAAGSTLSPLIAYLTQNYRLMLLVTALPQLIWLVWLIFWIPESARWLLSKDKYDEASVVIAAAAKTNGKDVSNLHRQLESLKLHLKKEKSADERRSFIDLLRSKKLLIYTLMFYIIWFTNAFVYYGISLNVSDLGSSLFWNTFWSGIIEFPSYLSLMLLMKLFGRRSNLILIMSLSGVSCLAVIPFYTFAPMNHTVVQVFALAGKFCATASFALIYVYSCEVYPTSFRQIGLGSCSTFARFGSILSPFMKELTAYANYGTTMALYSFFALFSAVCVIALPETKGKRIPDSITDSEKLSSKPN